MTDAAYPIKHWTATMLLGPLTSALVSYFFTQYDNTYINLYFLILIFGVVYATPALAIYYLVFWYWVQKMSSAFLQKIVLNAIAIAMTLTTFYFLNGTFFVPEVKTGYCTAIIISSLFLKIRTSDRQGLPHLENFDSK